MNTALKISRLSHKYNEQLVFEGLSLEVHAGELLTLFGKSGCGKTTLIRDVAGLSTPSDGEIWIANKQVFGSGNTPPQQRGVGLVFQDYALFPTLSVEQNIGFGLRNKDPVRVAELISKVGLQGLEHRFPDQLSGGQQQRVALARSLAPKPKILLMDEPFANLDALRKFQLAEDLRELLQSEDACAVLITHDREDALSFSDRIAIMGKGENASEILQLDTSEAVYRFPKNKTVAELLGHCNFIRGSWDGTLLKTALGHLSPTPEALHALGSYRGLAVACIRPEDLEISAGSRFQATSSCFLGNAFRIICADQQNILSPIVAYSQTKPTGLIDILSTQPVWMFQAPSR